MDNREELNPERPTPAPVPASLFPPHDAVQAGPPPAGPPHRATTVVDGDPTIRQWLAANAIALVVVACVISFIFYWFHLEGVIAIAKAFLGLSFVVFIHEMGHFLVAKWCDVHVTTFSIGFGPAIPGCVFQRGETTYKFSLVPIGGYVQMVGQVDGDESADGSEEDPRSFRNKSVGQRMAIISAGVIMNVILAVICFVVVFRGPGKERMAGVVDKVDTSGPAFKDGVRTGARIAQIGDTRDPHFEDLIVRIMGSTRDEKVRFVSELPGQPPITLDIEPRKNKTDTKPMIGISPPPQLVFETRRAVNPDMSGPYLPGSAVAEADAFQFGDRVIATTDPEDPSRVTELPDDPRYPGDGRHDYFAFARRMKLLADRPVVIRVERTQDEHPVTKDVTVAPMDGMTLGVRMQMGPISAIRIGSAAKKSGLIERDAAGTREGDRIEAVAVTEPDGKVTRFDEKNLDPERLPYQLKQWARRLSTAQARDKSKKADWTVTLKLRRHRVAGGEQFDTVDVELAWDDAWHFDDDVPIGVGSPLAIPELGLAYQVKTVVAAIYPGKAGETPLQVGDVIKNFRRTYLDVNGEKTTGKWLPKDLEEGQWAGTSYALLRSPLKILDIQLKVQRGKDLEEFTVTPLYDATWPLEDRGWLFRTDTRRQRADNVAGAISLGVHDTVNSMKQVFQNLRGMITGRVSVDNLSGPVLIANRAYLIAGYDFWEFVFFLGLISVNLAVVNFLPIPVLDGGHFVFLLYEKLRGRAASEPIRVVATYAGLALILSLFVFVTWLDIWRLW